MKDIYLIFEEGLALMYYQRKVLIFVLSMTMISFIIQIVLWTFKNSNHLDLAIITAVTHIFAKAILKCLKI